RLKCAIFSNNRKSSKSTGPRGPTVSEFWLSPTGRPASGVILFFSSATDSSSVHLRRLPGGAEHCNLRDECMPRAPILPIYSSDTMDRYCLWTREVGWHRLQPVL